MEKVKSLIKNNYLFRPLVWLNLIRRYETEKWKDGRLKSPRSNTPESIQYRRCVKWFDDNGNETLWLDHDLNEESIVFDLGGYKGEFASCIHNKYNCVVHTFEPIPEFYEIIRKKFLNNPKIYPHCFGLASETTTAKISLLDNSSSLFIQDSGIEIQLKRAINFMEENKIPKVDLIKVNIEGAEYDLLEDLLKNGETYKFRNIMIQFHDFIVPNARERMIKIQNLLRETHDLVWNYEFVWEKWTLREHHL